MLTLAEHLSDRGSELDFQWMTVFTCVVQLIMAANRNNKEQFITISAKAIHGSAEIVRVVNVGVGKVGLFEGSRIRGRIRELETVIVNVAPKKFMMSTRMSIGVWPPPDAISDMIKEAASLAGVCRELVLLGNSTGYFPVLETVIDLSFRPFEETETSQANEDLGTKVAGDGGGLDYAEYRRQNNLRLIDSLSKGQQSSVQTVVDSATEITRQEQAFFAILDGLLKQFVQSVSDLKYAFDRHLKEEFVTASSVLYERVELLIEEIRSSEAVRDLTEDYTIDASDLVRITSLYPGVKLGIKAFPAILKNYYNDSMIDVRTTAKLITVRAKYASDPKQEASAALEMLHATIPCIMSVKKLVVISKEITTKILNSSSDERRKREMWKRECLQNERVKKMFQMWENQVLGESNTASPGTSKIISTGTILTADELKMLEEPTDGMLIEDVAGKKMIKGGKLGQLILMATHYANPGIF